MRPVPTQDGCRLWIMEVAPTRKCHTSYREVRWVPLDQERPDWRHAGHGTQAVVIKARPLTETEARQHLAGRSKRDIPF